MLECNEMYLYKRAIDDNDDDGFFSDDKILWTLYDSMYSKTKFFLFGWSM